MAVYATHGVVENCPCVLMQVYEDSDVVGTAVDILMSIAEFHCSILRDYILQDTESQSEVHSRTCTLGDFLF